MFSGEEKVSVATDLPAEKFRRRVRRALSRFGDTQVGDEGELAIRASGSLGSFLSRAKLISRVEPTDCGYDVTVRYSLSPSVACWIAAAVLFTAAFLGAAIVFLPMLERTTVGDAVRGALRDLKREVEDRSGRPLQAGRSSHGDD